MSCYEEGEALFRIGKIAEEIQQGKVDIPGYSDYMTRKVRELSESVDSARTFLSEEENARVDEALDELKHTGTSLPSNRRILVTEKIIRIVQLPMTTAALKCAVQQELVKPREINPKQGQVWTEQPATEEQKAAIFDLARKKHIELTEKDVPYDMTKGAARALQYELLKLPFGGRQK